MSSMDDMNYKMDHLSLDEKYNVLQNELQKQATVLSQWKNDNILLQNNVNQLYCDKQWLQELVNRINTAKNGLESDIDKIWSEEIPDLMHQISILKEKMDQQYHRKIKYNKNDSLLINIGHILIRFIGVAKYDDSRKNLTGMIEKDRAFVHHVLGRMYGCTIIDNSCKGYYYQKDYIEGNEMVKKEIYSHPQKYEALWTVLSGHGKKGYKLIFSDGTSLPVNSIRAAFGNSVNGLGDIFIGKPRFITVDCCLGSGVIEPMRGQMDNDDEFISKGGKTAHPFADTYIMCANVNGFRSFGSDDGSFLIRAWLKEMIKGRVTNFSEKMILINDNLMKLSNYEQICQLVSTGTKTLYFRGYPNVNHIESSLTAQLEIISNLSSIQSKTNAKSEINAKCEVFKNVVQLTNVLEDCVAETDRHLSSNTPESILLPQPAASNTNMFERPVPTHFVHGSEQQPSVIPHHDTIDILDYGLDLENNPSFIANTMHDNPYDTISDQSLDDLLRKLLLSVDQQSMEQNQFPYGMSSNSWNELKGKLHLLLLLEDTKPNDRCNCLGLRCSIPDSTVRSFRNGNTESLKIALCIFTQNIRNMYNHNDILIEEISSSDSTPSPSSSTITIDRAKTFKCTHCNGLFYTKNDRKLHIQRMHEQRRFKCGQCGKAFGVKKDLKVHRRIHDAAKPFVCGQCHKRFRTIHLLKQHLPKHSKKSFKCNLCPKAYTYKSGLSAHMKHVHGISNK